MSKKIKETQMQQSLPLTWQGNGEVDLNMPLFEKLDNQAAKKKRKSKPKKETTLMQDELELDLNLDEEMIAGNELKEEEQNIAIDEGAIEVAEENDDDKGLISDTQAIFDSAFKNLEDSTEIETIEEPKKDFLDNINSDDELLADIEQKIQALQNECDAEHEPTELEEAASETHANYYEEDDSLIVSAVDDEPDDIKPKPGLKIIHDSKGASAEFRARIQRDNNLTEPDNQEAESETVMNEEEMAAKPALNIKVPAANAEQISDSQNLDKPSLAIVQPAAGQDGPSLNIISPAMTAEDERLAEEESHDLLEQAQNDVLSAQMESQGLEEMVDEFIANDRPEDSSDSIEELTVPRVSLSSSTEAYDSSIGQILKKGRMAKGLSIAAVCEATRISTEYIKALEEEDYDNLPLAPIYIKSYLKSLARKYDLNAEKLIKVYEKQSGIEIKRKRPVVKLDDKPAVDNNAKDEKKAVPFKLNLAVLLVVSIIGFVLVSAAFYRSFSQQAITPEDLAALNSTQLESYIQDVNLPSSESVIP